METCNSLPRLVDPTVLDFRKDVRCPDLLSSYLSLYGPTSFAEFQVVSYLI
jgi:hypothetical protein